MTSGYRLSTVADLESLELLQELMQRIAEDYPDVSSLDWSLLETAMVELLNNLILHGQEAGGEAVEFTLEIEVDAERLTVQICDTGSPSPDPAERAMPGVWEEDGRGLALTRAVVDELTYERRDAQNTWTLVRLRHSA